MAVDVSLDGGDALAHVAVNPYDVVVLDRDLPGVHGDQVCRQLVAEHARHSRADADRREHDPRPRSRASSSAQTTTSPSRSSSPSWSRGCGRSGAGRGGPRRRSSCASDLTLDSARRVGFRGERRLALSPKEFSLLEYLLAADGRVVSAEELLARVWDEAADPFTNTVKTTIGRLRTKLGEPRR